MAAQRTQEPKAGGIDTHVHIFRRDARLAADHRYAPGYDALPSSMLANLRAAGLSRAVLVQPSFLGTDNSDLLHAIAGNPSAFAGIAVVDPAIGPADLETLRRGGVVGVRLNCIGKPVPDFAGAHARLAQQLGALGMVLQVQAEGAQWRAMEAFLASPPCRVVIDHFGRTAMNDPSGGFESLLRAAGQSDRLWFKFSAPYRMDCGQVTPCANAILHAVGSSRIVWGSDWPHTQFEARQSYHDTLDWLSTWIPAAADRAMVLSSNPVRLFGLNAGA